MTRHVIGESPETRSTTKPRRSCAAAAFPSRSHSRSSMNSSSCCWMTRNSPAYRRVGPACAACSGPTRLTASTSAPPPADAKQSPNAEGRIGSATTTSNADRARSSNAKAASLSARSAHSTSSASERSSYALPAPPASRRLRYARCSISCRAHAGAADTAGGPGLPRDAGRVGGAWQAHRSFAREDTDALEAMFHRQYMHLKFGTQRLWQVRPRPFGRHCHEPTSHPPADGA
jgi:hypothetical protein